MKVDVQHLDKFMRSVTVEIPAADVEVARQGILKELRSQVQMPGFRKGKVPDTVIEKRFESHIREKTVEKLVEPAAREVLEHHIPETGFNPQVEKLTWQPGTDMSFIMKVEVRPAMTVEGYKGVARTRSAYEVEEQDIDRAVQDLQGRVATIQPVEREAQEGDVVVVDLAEVHPGEDPDDDKIRKNMQILLTPELLAEPFGAALRGAAKNDLRRVVPNAEQPESELWVRVTDVCESVVPAADDEFFAKMGLGKDAVAGREMVANMLRRDEERRSLNEMATAILDDVMSKVDIELGPSQQDTIQRVLASEADRAKQEEREPRDPAELEQLVIRQLKKESLIEAIAEQEKIEIDEHELDAEVARIAERARVSRSDARKRLEESGRIFQLAREMLESKVLSFMVDQTQVTVDTKKRDGRSRIVLPNDLAAGPGSRVIVPGR